MNPPPVQPRQVGYVIDDDTATPTPSVPWRAAQYLSMVRPEGHATALPVGPVAAAKARFS
jgi:hypothetical protein